MILLSNPPPLWNFLGLWPSHPPGISNSLRGGGLDIFWNHTFICYIVRNCTQSPANILGLYSSQWFSLSFEMFSSSHFVIKFTRNYFKKGQSGRPKFDINEETLIELRTLGYNWNEIAGMLLVSRWTIQKWWRKRAPLCSLAQKTIIRFRYGTRSRRMN